MADEGPGDGQLKRSLGLGSATAVIVGSMIGSGILILPATMLGYLPSPLWVLLVFFAAAAMTVVGALTVAELAGMHPGAGGQYAYLREAFGPAVAYLFGWTTFWVVQTGTIAAVAAAFAQVLGRFVDLPGAATPLVLGGWDTGILLPPWGQAYVAVGVIALLSLVNHLGVRFGGWVQNASTLAKGAGLVLLVGLILLFGSGGTLDPLAPEGVGSFGILKGFMLALALCLFMYDGWYSATYVAAEVRNPQRNVPLALILGPLTTTAIYLAVAAASLFAVPLMQATSLGPGEYLAGRAVENAVGAGGATLVTVLALVSIFGTVNAYVLTAPRISWALARDGFLLRSMANLHPTRGTPGYGMLVSGLWACLLVFTGLYDQLSNMVIFAVFAFHIPTALAMMLMRRSRPDHPRPFRTPGYPVVPILYLLSSIAIVVADLVFAEYRVQAVIASLVILAGIPAYLVQRRRGTPLHPSP